MAVPWTWAFDTPFNWTKQIASHFGGTRQGMAISWPGHIKDKGGIRKQFHHVIDIVPTILEATGIPAPETVDGIKQKPIEGVSIAYTFDKANANTPSTHTTQYFEMMGVHAIYHDGWMLHDTGSPAVGRLVARPSRIRPTTSSGSCTTSPRTGRRPTTSPRATREGEGAAGPVLGGSPQVSGAAAGCLGGDASRGAAAQHHGGPDGVHLHQRR